MVSQGDIIKVSFDANKKWKAELEYNFVKKGKMDFSIFKANEKGYYFGGSGRTRNPLDSHSHRRSRTGRGIVPQTGGSTRNVTTRRGRAVELAIVVRAYYE